MTTSALRWSPTLLLYWKEVWPWLPLRLGRNIWVSVLTSFQEGIYRAGQLWLALFRYGHGSIHDVAESEGSSETCASQVYLGTNNMADEVGKAIYEDFLPRAIRDGWFIVTLEPLIVGKELKHIQEAIDLNKKGVSARKLLLPSNWASSWHAIYKGV